MLRKALGELGRVSRTKRTAMLAGTLLLMLGLMTVAVVLAADPVVDGTIGSDWQSSDIVRMDPEDGSIDDQYDIGPVYMRSSDNNLNFFAGLEVYSDTIVMNSGGWIHLGFDTDVDSGTGGPVDSGACPNIGAEYLVEYYYDGDVEEWETRLRWWDPGYVPPKFRPRSYAVGAHGPDWEMGVAYSALGLTTTQCISIGIHFENGAIENDDSVCDMTWCYTDGTTAVDLSSFSASPGGSHNPVVQPVTWALLALGLAFVAFGGLVLWRGRSLAG